MRRLCLIAWVVGCTASPLPEAPFEGDFEFEPATGSVPFISVEGAIHPDHRLRIWELDTMAPSQTLAPNADGTVEGALGAMATRARLETHAGSRRSTPLDVDVTTGAALATSACVVIATQLEAEVGLAIALEVRNECDAPLDVSMQTRAIAPITVPEARALAAGEVATFELTATSSTDEIVLIELSGAVEETRALTVYTR